VNEEVRNGDIATDRSDEHGAEEPSARAFPHERKEPLIDAAHVRNAVARFDQVRGVTDAERDRAWRRIRAAARKYGVEISARGWRELVKDNTRR